MGKDEKAKAPGGADRLASLDQVFLVVFADEFYLSAEVIADYVHQIRAPRASHIDRVFFLGPYEPALNNAVRRDRKHIPIEDKAHYTAF